MPEPTILETILAHKRVEVAARRALVPDREMEQRARAMPPPRPFADALSSPRSGPLSLIAEVKRASPSAGVIRADFDPAAIARAYEAGGADCLSVLTDERFFSGHDDYLAQARDAVALPVLRKDFIVDAYQIAEARALGADAVLLIVSALTPWQLAEFQDAAHALGMAALVEVHTEIEMHVALEAGATLLGINNRNLSTFTTDLQTTARLAALAPKSATLVAESGLRTPADLATVRRAGAHAVLVGETFMRAPDIAAAVRALMSIE